MQSIVKTDESKSYKTSSTLNYSWNIVASFFWRRYPNPHAKHVLSEDILHREILPDGSLYTRRLTTKKHIKSLPFTIKYFFRNKEYILEESVISPKQQSMNTLTYNVGDSRKYGVFNEKCSYLPINSVHQQTIVNKFIWIESKMNSFFSKSIIPFLMYYYKKSSVKSSKGYDYVIKNHFMSNIVPLKSTIFSKPEIS